MQTIIDTDISSKHLFAKANELLEGFPDISADNAAEIRRCYSQLIENCILFIMLKEQDPIVSFVLRRLNRDLTMDFPYVAAVSIINESITLNVNPLMVKMIGLNLNEFIGVLKHEALHVLNNHFLRENKFLLGDKVNRKLLNIAEDLAINQYLPVMCQNENFIHMGTIFKMFPELDEYLKKNKLKLQERRESEYYYNAFKQGLSEETLKDLEEDNNENIVYVDQDTYNKLKDDLNGNGTGETLEKFKEGLKNGKVYVFDHKEMDLSAADYEKIANACEEIQDQLQKEGITDKARGTGSAAYSEIISRMKEKPLIDWRRRLGQIVGSIPYGKRGTFLRENRRLPHRLDLKGRLPARAINVVIALDTSGSMSKDQLEEIFVEFEGMKDNGARFTVIECDYDIKHVYNVELNSPKNKGFNYNVHGRGGTAFTPVFKYIKENHIKPDLFVYFTDGYGESVIPHDYLLPSSTKIMWVLSGGTAKTISCNDPKFVRNICEMKSRKLKNI